MADLDIARLRALLAKATRGPWLPWPTSGSHPIASVRDDDGDEANIWTDGDVFRGTKQDDRALIVAAVNALPALLDAADPETLRFGAWRDDARRALSADGTLYRIFRLTQRGIDSFFAQAEDDWDDYEDIPGGTSTTEEKAIEAAREHDRRRRGAK